MKVNRLSNYVFERRFTFSLKTSIEVAQSREPLRSAVNVRTTQNKCIKFLRFRSEKQRTTSNNNYKTKDSSEKLKTSFRNNFYNLWPDDKLVIY